MLIYTYIYIYIFCIHIIYIYLFKSRSKRTLLAGRKGSRWDLALKILSAGTEGEGQKSPGGVVRCTTQIIHGASISTYKTGSFIG